MTIPPEKNPEKDRILAADFVESDYFLCRIKHFEQQYGMSWGDFLAKYSLGSSEISTAANSDFAEWAFLCNNFMSELIELESASPPTNVTTGRSQEPEADSGSCFERGNFVRRRTILRYGCQSSGYVVQPYRTLRARS